MKVVLAVIKAIIFFALGHIVVDLLWRGFTREEAPFAAKLGTGAVFALLVFLESIKTKTKTGE